jgi:hypothetical protein
MVANLTGEQRGELQRVLKDMLRDRSGGGSDRCPNHRGQHGHRKEVIHRSGSAAAAGISRRERKRKPK